MNRLFPTACDTFDLGMETRQETQMPSAKMKKNLKDKFSFTDANDWINLCTFHIWFYFRQIT